MEKKESQNFGIRVGIVQEKNLGKWFYYFAASPRHARIFYEMKLFCAVSPLDVFIRTKILL